MPSEFSDRLAARTDDEIGAELAALADTLAASSAMIVGFPVVTDIDVAALTPFLTFMLNNVSDSGGEGQYPLHTKSLESDAWQFVADLLGAPPTDRWGYVTGGATEGNEHGLYLARQMYPNGLAYLSEAAHPTIVNVLDRLRMDYVIIRAEPSGEIDYADLAVQVNRHRRRPAIVVACVGTPLSEAVDDVARIGTVLDDRAVSRRWIHADAARSGLALALLDTDRRPAFDFTAGIRSIAVSGHKFPGTPIPCGVFLVRDSDRPYRGRAATHTGGPDSTWSNSRSGFAVLCLWYALRKHGADGLRVRAARARELADHAHQRLLALGWPAWRPNPNGFTVVLQTPPGPVAENWSLPVHGSTSHLICMPDLTRERIDAFLGDLEAATTSRINPLRVPPRPPSAEAGTPASSSPNSHPASRSATAT